MWPLHVNLGEAVTGLYILYVEINTIFLTLKHVHYIVYLSYNIDSDLCNSILLTRMMDGYTSTINPLQHQEYDKRVIIIFQKKKLV